MKKNIPKYMKIKIKGKNKLNNKKNMKEIKSYNGNETFYITQENQNGELLDYAVLYGKKDEKIFIGFQMKCYTSHTDIESKFIDKGSIKKTLSPIILNSINLFNCLIKEWHYYIIYNYNIDDDSTLNVGERTLFKTCKNNIEYLLYDPCQKIFYSKEKRKIKKLELSFCSNLDNISYVNDCSNYLCLPKYFFDEPGNEQFDEIFGKGLKNFVNDFKQYSEKPENLLTTLEKKLKIKNLFFCFSFYTSRIEFPASNQLLFYKKKNSSHFIAIYIDSDIIAFDLENGNKMKFIECRELIDIEYKNIYLMRYDDSCEKKEESIDDITPNINLSYERINMI